MADTKALGKQIETHRKELEAMRADEAELSRLHAEKSAELEAMRSGKSRDFAGMAALEGQRAALHTMLEEQRAEIAQTEARISDLEGQQAKQSRYDRLTATAAAIRKAQDEQHAGILALVDTVKAAMGQLIERREDWHTLRARFIEDALALGVPIHNQGWDQMKLDQARAFMHDLEERGADVEALKVNPFGEDWQQRTRVDTDYRFPFIPQGELHPYADFDERILRLVARLYSDAVTAYLVADAPKARAYRESNGGKA
ncbi:hypothetical protein RDMS_00225 [Deinococcus sp. RL]|nr:hypothetical protein RDMS_00225 [Deinococcus sp. RL]